MLPAQYQHALPRGALTRLKAPLFVDENFPDWFIAFGSTVQTAQLAQYFCRVHREDGGEITYSYRLETNLNTYWFDTSRPELPLHTFGPKNDFDPRLESVYLTRRLPARKVKRDGVQDDLGPARKPDILSRSLVK